MGHDRLLLKDLQLAEAKMSLCLIVLTQNHEDVWGMEVQLHRS
jgi:hypothetical protein